MIFLIVFLLPSGVDIDIEDDRIVDQTGAVLISNNYTA